jgi:4-hydroxy-3-methylbut-2-enyl diphosphate reductase
MYCAGLALILGGALGNLIDRLVLGKVTDFLLFHYAQWAYPRSMSRTVPSRSARDFSSSTASAGRGTMRPRRPKEPECRFLLANPRGFCAGVDRAIAIVEQALTPLRRSDLRAPRSRAQQVRRRRPEGEGRGVRGGAHGGPAGSTVVFSAHGVPKSVRADADARGLRVFDATCPLVTKVHSEVEKMRAHGREIVMIGHAGHPEVEGTMGQCDGGIHLVESVADVDRLAGHVRRSRVRHPDYAVRRRRRGDRRALKRRFPGIVGPKKDDICYATQNRQDAVKFMDEGGRRRHRRRSPNSSNSNRLREVAANRGVAAYMIDRADQLRPEWVAGKVSVGSDGGCVGAGGAGAGGSRPPLRARCAPMSTSSTGVAERIVFPVAEGARSRTRLARRPSLVRP